MAMESKRHVSLLGEGDFGRPGCPRMEKLELYHWRLPRLSAYTFARLAVGSFEDSWDPSLDFFSIRTTKMHTFAASLHIPPGEQLRRVVIETSIWKLDIYHFLTSNNPLIKLFFRNLTGHKYITIVLKYIHIMPPVLFFSFLYRARA